MVKYTQSQIVELIMRQYDQRRVYILAPLVKNRKGHYKELFENLRKKGYINVRIDGELTELNYGLKVERYRNHSIELVIDRMRIRREDQGRVAEAVSQALRQGEKQMMVLDYETEEPTYFSQLLMDAENGISYAEPAPHNFSFNSPQGACPHCKGLGMVNLMDRDKIIPNPSKSIYDGGIEPLGRYKNNLIFWQIEAICKLHGGTIKTPIKELAPDAIDDILNGTETRLHLENSTMVTSQLSETYDGLVKYIEMQADDDAGAAANKWSGQFYTRQICPQCHGSRLNREALHFFIDDKTIADLGSMDLSQLLEWVNSIENKLGDRKRAIACEILKEIRSRLKFLIDVGLHYLSLNRASASLSGGESQRIRLATQIGSQLVGVLYILDEPSIGLHQRDNTKLIHSLCQLRDAGNSVIVVEHDKEIMQKADYIVDIGRQQEQPVAGSCFKVSHRKCYQHTHSQLTI